MDDTIQACVKNALSELKNIERVLNNVAETSPNEDVAKLLNSVKQAIEAIEAPGNVNDHVSAPTFTHGGSSSTSDDDGAL